VNMNHVDSRERNAQKVERMFTGISSRYDLLNHTLSLGLDIRWRKKVAEATGDINCRDILDVCTGTGDMAIELCRFWKGRARIEGLDLSKELIGIGQAKAVEAGMGGNITFREGNAEELPYGDEQFDAVTVTFGLRNIQDRPKALRAFHRVTKPGGCFVCLEFSHPCNQLFSGFYFFYLMKIVPVISRMFGSNPEAYRYLGNTIKDFPGPDELAGIVGSAGWKDVAWKRLSGGIVALHIGRK